MASSHSPVLLLLSVLFFHSANGASIGLLNANDGQDTTSALARICATYKNDAENDARARAELAGAVNDFLSAMNRTQNFRDVVDSLKTKGMSNDESVLSSQLKELWFRKAFRAGVDIPPAFKSTFCLYGVENAVALFTAYSECALTEDEQKQTRICASKIHGKETTILVSLFKDDTDTTKIEEAKAISSHFPSVDNASLTRKHKKHGDGGRKNKTKGDSELRDLVNNMWDADAPERISASDITLNWGKHIRNGESGQANEPLFTSVNEAAFADKPVYQALLEIYNNTDLFHPPVCTSEPSMDAERRAKLDRFLKVVTDTPVFHLAYAYLKKKGMGGKSMDDFRGTLFSLWFGTYSRCGDKKTKGSSGWEHVFRGEYRDEIVDGQHYWLRYYLLQKNGEIKYNGYHGYVDGLIGTIQYTWNGYEKQTGGFLLRSSPAFDFSLFTVCSMTHSGSQACKFKIEGNDMFVTSYQQDCTAGSCLSTSYPGIKF